MLTPALVKEQSSPPVYLLYSGRLFWIPSPTDFDAMAFDWSRVQIMADGSLAGIPRLPFTIAAPNKPSDPDIYDLPVGEDWNTVLALDCKDPLARVTQHILVAGWLCGQMGLNALNDGADIEDWIADLVLDVDFLLALYGPGGLSTALVGKSLPGNTDRLSSLGNPLPISYASDGEGHSGIDINSLILPQNSRSLGSWALPQPMIHIELNCWHLSNHPATHPPWKARNPVPTGWSPLGTNKDPDAYWPFNPMNPDNGPRDLQTGDFVVVRGTLWQDFCHPGQSVFNTGPLTAQGGWTEIHPIDWIQRAPAPPMPVMAAVVALGDRTSNIQTFLVPDTTRLATQFPVALDVQEYVDTRYTDAGSVSQHVIRNACDSVAVDTALSNSGGRFKSIVNARIEAAPCSVLGVAANLMLFKCGQGRGILLNQLNPASQGWTGWRPVLTGGPGSLPTNFASTSGFAAASLQNSLYLFAPGRGLDPAHPLTPIVEALFYKSWNSTAPPNPTAPWEQFDGQFTSSPTVATWGSVMHLFVRGGQNDVLYNRLDLSNSASWQGWQSLGGVATSSPSCIVLGGVIWVFVKGLDDALYFKTWDSATPPGPTVAWGKMDGRFSSSPSLLADGPQVVHLFVRGPDLDVLYNRLDTNTASLWSGFQSLGGLATSSPASALVPWTYLQPVKSPPGENLPPISVPAVAKYVFVVGEGDQIYYKSWGSLRGLGPEGPDPNSPWSQVPD